MLRFLIKGPRAHTHTMISCDVDEVGGERLLASEWNNKEESSGAGDTVSEQEVPMFSPAALVF